MTFLNQIKHHIMNIIKGSKIIFSFYKEVITIWYVIKNNKSNGIEVGRDWRV